MRQEVFSGMNSESVPTFLHHWVLIQENLSVGVTPKKYSHHVSRCLSSVEEKQSKRMNLPPSSASVFVVCKLLMCVASYSQDYSVKSNIQ